MRVFLGFLFFAFTCSNLFAQEVKYKEIKNIIYTPIKDTYAQKQCKLDLYFPEGVKDYVTLIWFHGGGLTSGDRTIPPELKNNGFAVISVGYRFAPHVEVEDIIKDGAQATSWAVQNLPQYGGNPHKIIVGGYSAGAYLALMLGLQKDYLSVHQYDADSLLSVISCSGQTITHFTERQHRNIKENQPLVDRLAPLYWVRKSPFPITLITGDRELEMLGRYEENAYLARMLKLSGHPKVQLFELQGYSHNMLYPALPLVIQEIKRLAKK